MIDIGFCVVLHSNGVSPSCTNQQKSVIILITKGNRSKALLYEGHSMLYDNHHGSQADMFFLGG